METRFLSRPVSNFMTYLTQGLRKVDPAKQGYSSHRIIRAAAFENPPEFAKALALINPRPSTNDPSAPARLDQYILASHTQAADGWRVSRQKSQDGVLLWVAAGIYGS
jgi:hypothetical protein